MKIFHRNAEERLSRSLDVLCLKDFRLKSIPEKPMRSVKVFNITGLRELIMLHLHERAYRLINRRSHISMCMKKSL